LPLLVLLLGAPLGAEAAQPDEQRQRAPVVRVRMLDRGGNNRFRPATVTIDRGTRVRWVNVGNDDHTTTSNTGAWDRWLDPGERFTRRFRTAGTFPYRCTIHPEMVGTVVVR
jgi:plastocyanin